ncbi:hypothetical protein NADFUDRAFT_82698 [Nadsonia fulvescens var. elongata DSM 6958]|uniref:HIG1 domain-containing protein n=1 Tax=Nadsonia fulvescens var. elongata DSM 6958 TaxID=857566 RepID=A0A1E3PJX3_9ASCO|nr:hypothetical protein NADFUDRAFT_82698 [Nadsonia fulvescens var. elongata DSM 6958]
MKPAHHAPEKVEGAVDVILQGTAIGGTKGLFAGLALGTYIRYFQPKVWQRTTIQFRSFVLISLFCGGAVFSADKRLVDYEQKLRYEDIVQKSKLLDEAAERGEFIDFDGVKK